MQTTARTTIVLSPLPDRTPGEVKALMSLAESIRRDQRVRRAEAELRRLNPRLLTDIGFEPGTMTSLGRPRIAR
jgi:uncharacterized protein YjiS (DUF1127 family)